MNTGFRLRLYLFTIIVLVGCGALLMRLHAYMIDQQKDFVDMLPRTKTESIREPGVRGSIHDRSGIVLAENLISREVTFNLREIYEAWRDGKRTETLPPEAIARMDEILAEKGKKPEQASISDIVNALITPRLEELGLAKEFSERAMDIHYSTYSGNVPYVYRGDLTQEEFARFAENLSSFPGFDVSSQPHRNYPYGALASHVLGKMREWDKGNIPEEGKAYDYYIGDPRGVEGIEASMDEMLRGPHGARTIRKDEKNQYIGLADVTLPGEGATVTLTIDARIQTLAEKALRRIGLGAAVVMDVNTGEVIAMASVPDFDPNDFIPPTNGKRLGEYILNPASPFTNRAISPHAPGSTFKINTALASFRAGKGAHIHVCEGKCPIEGDYAPACWIWKEYRGAHGPMKLHEALQSSCNPYFFKMALEIPRAKFVDTQALLGVGRKTGIRLPNEQPGILPGSDYWRRVLKPGERFTKSLLAQLSIGQGDTEATPLQMASIVSAVANGGRYYQPRIIKRVEHPANGVLIEDTPVLKVDLLEQGIGSDDLDLIRQGMWLAANEKPGTARRAAPKGIDIGAKTGTAQTSRWYGRAKSKSNCWTVAFAPYDAPRYAVVVMVENGKGGGSVAGPIVRLILKGLFSSERGVVLPVESTEPHAGHTDFIEPIELEDDDPLLLASEDLGETIDSLQEQAPPELVPNAAVDGEVLEPAQPSDVPPPGQ